MRVYLIFVMGGWAVGKAFEILLVVCVALAVVSMLSLQVVLCNDFDYACDEEHDFWGTWGNRAEIYGYHGINPLRYAHETHIAQAWTNWPMVVLEGDVYFKGIIGQEYYVHIHIPALDYYESAHYDYYTGSVTTESNAYFYNSITGSHFEIDCHAHVTAGTEP
jgi:hypothetical protein